METKNKYYVKVCNDMGFEIESYYCKMTVQQVTTIENFLKMVKNTTYYIQKVEEDMYIEI